MDQQSQQNYSCKFCNFSTSEKEDLRSHLSSKHKEFKCSICQEKFYNLQDIRTHIRKVHLVNWTCQICDKSFASESQYESHCKFHLNIASDCIKTTIRDCDSQKDIMKESRQSQAISTSYKAQEIHKCIFCNFIANDKDMLNCHLPSHITIEILECSECGVYFEQKFQLEKHKVAHKKIYYQCDVCNRKSQAKNLIVKHINEKHTSPSRGFRNTKFSTHL